MKIIKNNFCEIFTSETNVKTYTLEYENYCISIKTFSELNLNNDFTIPTLIIGWDYIKNNFDKARISKKKIKNNLYWTFSESEDKNTNNKDLNNFLKKSLNEFLPSNYETFDCILQGNILNQSELIFDQSINFCYVSKNVLYVYNQNKFYGINLESIDYIYNNKSEFFKFILNRYRIIFFNYENIIEYLKIDDIFIETLENICWICNNFILTETSLHKFSPFPINEKYFVFLMSKFFEMIKCSLIENKEILIRLNKKDQITKWLSQRHIHFIQNKNLILKYSNKRTITGRINCVDKKFNPQLLPKNSEIRSQIVSEFKFGKIHVFDYVSFETKLSVYLTKNEEFIKKLENNDIHQETSKIIFEKNIITPNERKIGKQINHAIIYGVGNEKLKSILQQNNINTKVIDKIKKFLKPIIENSKELSENFKKQGFITNPYNTVIYPNKEWAVYNNYVQSIAADMVIDKLFKIKNFLKNYKSNFMYQVYDSFVFDIHPDESEITEFIKKILESNGKYNFEVKIKSGNNLMDCTEQEVEEEIEYIN